MLTNISDNSSSLLSQNPAVVYLASLAPGSRPTMKQSLNTIAGMLIEGTDLISFPWHELRYQHTTAIRSLLQEKYAAATANKMLCALKRVLLECKRLGLMSVEDCDRACDLKQIKGNSPLKGRALSAWEISKLVEACKNDNTPVGIRDLAIIAVLRVGLRRSEVVGLNVGDINSDGSVTVRHGKGNKTRVVYLSQAGLDYLCNWSKVLLKSNTDPLFIAASRSGSLTNRRLTAQSIRVILEKRAKLAGITDAFSPHDLRRTCITDLLNAGVDIGTVQKIAGHSSIETTIRYDHRDDSVKKKAMELLEL